MTALVVGLAGPGRQDDEVGIEVGRRLAERGTDAVVVHREDPSRLIDLWDGAEVAVVIDAVRSGRPAGEIVVLDLGSESLPPERWSAGGSHALGLAAVVELARKLDRLPRRLLVVGIEVQRTGMGQGLSEPVRAAVDAAVDATLDAVREALAGPRAPGGS